MLDVELPDPQDIRQARRTGFSFSRFAIPRLAGYQGRALYVDADMQVFRDIRELWETPFDGAKVVIQQDIPENKQSVDKPGAPARRIKQSSVMLLDCDALRWIPEEIIGGLDGNYTYEELLYDLCILKDEEICYAIPYRWNSLEYWDESTCLTHYTDMRTQPWVSPNNRIGWVWINELKRMLHEGAISWERIVEDVRQGYVRPSLLNELKLDVDLSVADLERNRMLERIDTEAQFVMHKEVYENKRLRNAAIKAYEEKLRSLPAQSLTSR
jgi:lipopolysaccharide biosynthesis glycosyltransferase